MQCAICRLVETLPHTGTLQPYMNLSTDMCNNTTAVKCGYDSLPTTTMQHDYFQRVNF